MGQKLHFKHMCLVGMVTMEFAIKMRGNGGQGRGGGNVPEV